MEHPTMEAVPSMAVMTRILEKSQTNSAPGWMKGQLAMNELALYGQTSGVSVRQVPNETSASDRARWLAELAQALEEAQRLAWQLEERAGPEAMDLYARLEAARAEVRALQLGRRPPPAEETGPDWSDLTPWRRDGRES